MPALTADGVAKTFDRVRYVLEDVDLVVEPGEVVVLFGRSGSGKTTLLNVLAGLETPSTGRVLVAGIDLAELDDEARTRTRLEQLGVVFQRFHLLPELTVLENVTLPMRLAGNKEGQTRARELLAFFGVSEHEDAFPATLSGGETQRVAIARALANEPRVLLADEPTANLDEENARNALSALRRAADELGTAVLVASHDPLSKAVADRVLELRDGRIRRERTQVAPLDPATPSRGAGERTRVDREPEQAHAPVEAETAPAPVQEESTGDPGLGEDDGDAEGEPEDAGQAPGSSEVESEGEDEGDEQGDGDDEDDPDSDPSVWDPAR